MGGLLTLLPFMGSSFGKKGGRVGLELVSHEGVAWLFLEWLEFASFA